MCREAKFLFALTGIFVAFLGFAGHSFAQNSSKKLFISKYVPGNYIRDNEHRVELYNSTSRSLNISNYFLVTREYSVRIPSGTYIPPRSVFSIGKKNKGGKKLDLQLSKTQDFLIRFADPNEKGNFITLLDRSKKTVDGMFFTYSGDIPFLPDNGFTITFAGDTIYFSIPDESDAFFQGRSVFMGEDPTLCCFLQVEGNWIPTSENTNLSPATAYEELDLRFFEGIVTIKWKTKFEENANFHLVQRSRDGINFSTIEKVASKGKIFKGEEYAFYDAKVKEGEKYYYRIANKDIYGHLITSEIYSLVATDEPQDFQMDIFLGKGTNENEINIRFLSKQTQRVRIKLLDKGFREVAILFDDQIVEETQNLLKIREQLAAADYMIVAETSSGRFFQEFRVP